MKKVLFFFPTFLFCAALFGQGLQRSLQFAAQFGISPYEYFYSPGASVQYTVPLTKHFYATGNARLAWGRGTSRTANFSYTMDEVWGAADLSFLINLTPNASRNCLGVGLGGSLMATYFNYNRIVDVYRVTYGEKTALVPMVHFALEDQFYFTQRWGVFGRLTVRSSFEEKAVLPRNINDNRARTMGGIRENYTIDVGVAYRL